MSGNHCVDPPPRGIHLGNLRRKSLCGPRDPPRRSRRQSLISGTYPVRGTKQGKPRMGTEFQKVEYSLSTSPQDRQYFTLSPNPLLSAQNTAATTAIQLIQEHVFLTRTTNRLSIFFIISLTLVAQVI